MVWKYTTVVLLFGVYFPTDAFDITPKPKRIEATRGQTTKFNFEVIPWPPPCCDDSGQDIYRDVQLELWKTYPDEDLGVLLCKTHYIDGEWNEETGSCEDSRMLDYEPDPTDKIAFYLTQTVLKDIDDYYLKILYGGGIEMSQNASVMLHVRDAFNIVPLQEEIDSTRGKITKFQFQVNPWPPPCCNNPGQESFQDVKLEMWKTYPDDDMGDLLCRTEYIMGIWNNETESCNYTNPRMSDYEPDPIGLIAFNLRQTQIEDMDDYYLKILYADEALEISQNTSAILHVTGAPSLPQINSNALDTEMEVDERVEMGCKVGNSNPPAELKWTRDRYQLMPSINESVAEDWHGISWSVTEIKSVSHFDHGVLFQCEAKNDEGSTANSMTVYVRFKPYPTVGPCQSTDRVYFVEEGRRMTMTCDVKANPDVSLYTWNTDDMEGIPEGYNKSTLVLPGYRVTRELSGHFWCYAENDVGNGTEFCELDVQYGPETTFSHTHEIHMGENLTFPCSTDSNPPAEEFLWKRAGYNFRQEDIDLFIEHVEPEDAGNYTCDATATRTPTGGSLRPFTGSGTVTIHVIFAPRWEPFAISKFAGVPGTETSLVCNLQGYPDLTLSWQFEGEDISTGSRYQITTEGTTSTLSIKNVEAHDFGEGYTCNGENDEGKEVFVIELLKPGKPDEPQMCSVYNITDRTAILQCIPGYDGGADVLFNVEVQEDKTQENSEWSNFFTYSSHETTVFVRVDGMEPNTDYTLCIYAENEYGRSLGCYQAQIRTADGVPSPTSPPPNVAAIVGGVFGGLFFVLLVVGAVLYVRKYGLPKLPKKKKVPTATLR